MAKPLHPSVEQFKQFVKKHPKIIQEVRSGKKTWKQVYEDWYLFGEDDEIWDPYREASGKKKEEEKGTNKWLDKLAAMLGQLDAAEVQKHLANVQQAITAIQRILSEFQGAGLQRPNKEEHPFSFRKD
ncbi:cytosolic protein [Geobacillus subterraneus]|uniref:Cytosolic protein n=2 Tax=Geobacillus TaxID=129337 RepID=A0ABM6ACU1_9BACL|nr:MULTISPECIES: YlbD family protein [Geobacillus]AMX84148.1 cytosolic protein [Geobacillus subterraneus]KZS26938.1 cytosolic protein [Geobacillus subterraneus]OXB88356.1 cytosolic protein [Geobacillus uzenensis]QIZ67216.1 cytosolic protein [Geobacillus subterraneus]WPZ19399.1 YlbD family protein [Geobacillus subterraneus]